MSLLFLAVFLFGGVFCAKNTYRAASMHLVEFSTPEKYAEYVATAKDGGNELIVFPELSLGASKGDGENITGEGTIPCLVADPTTQNRQYTLSCAARNNQIYVVLSLVEYDGDKIYNTAIVFDRTGEIIAKYRKTHVLLTFLTPGDTGPVYFDTDFDVRFGVFVCFDILFKSPAELYPTEKYGISNLVYPTFWVTAPPFNALQTQQSYSEFFQVNIIASNDVQLSLGTGHFSKGSPLSWTMNKTNNVLLSSSFPIFPALPVPKLPSIPTTWEGPYIFQKWFQAFPSSSRSLSIETKHFTCDVSFDVPQTMNQWFTFFATRIGPKERSELIRGSYEGNGAPIPPTREFIIYEDMCGIIICDEGNNTSLQKCFNNSKRSGTYFSNFEMKMIVKDQVRSVRTNLLADKDELFIQQSWMSNPQYMIVHDDETHTVKSGPQLHQPTLAISITALLDDFNGK